MTSTLTSVAVVAVESRLVAVIAGAGSGKTRVLTRRVAYRIETGSALARHTLVLTFTRRRQANFADGSTGREFVTRSRPARSTR